MPPYNFGQIAQDAGMVPTGGPGAVGDQTAQLHKLVQQIMARASQPQMGMQQPRPQFSPESMQKQGFDTHHETNKRADVGQALGNMGTLIHNFVAQHKQNQIRDAMNEWDGFNSALEKAQVVAGDPSAPDYKQKVHQALSQDPWVKANLDPGNPKAVKRLKNMYKALNVDLLSGDENVHREGLKRFFKVKEAFQKMVGAKQKLDEHKQQGQGGQQMDPNQRTAQMQESIGKLMGNVKQPDPKQVEQGLEAAKVEAELRRTEADKYAIRNNEKGEVVAVDTTHPERGYVPIKNAEGKPLQSEDKHPVDSLLKEAFAASKAGDTQKANDLFALAHKGAEAKRTSAPSMMEMIVKANAGNKEAQAAMKEWTREREEIAQSYGMGRAAYMLHQYLVDGKPQVISNLDAAQLAKHGHELTMIGNLSAQQVVAVQRMQTEAAPAIALTRKYLSAYDNAKDRAIYAEVLKGVGPASFGQDYGWMRNVLTQALNKNLSPVGKRLAIQLRRLSDTMGTLRSAMALPSTELSMNLTLSLVPGPGTPSSAYAGEQLDQVEQMVKNAIDIGMYRDIGSGGGNQAPIATSPDDF